MTTEQYNTCYNIGTHRTPPYGELVEAYALGLLAHKNAAQTVREWVYEQAFELVADLDMTASTELWSLFRDLTRDLCIKMLKLPEAKNPLTLPDSGGSAVPTTKLEMFYELLRGVPFDCKRVLLLTYLFEEGPEQIGYILSKPVEEVLNLIQRGNAELGVAFLHLTIR